MQFNQRDLYNEIKKIVISAAYKATLYNFGPLWF